MRITPESVESFLKQGLDVVDLFCEKREAPEELDLLDRVLEEAQAVLEGLERGQGN